MHGRRIVARFSIRVLNGRSGLLHRRVVVSKVEDIRDDAVAGVGVTRSSSAERDGQRRGARLWVGRQLRDRRSVHITDRVSEEHMIEVSGDIRSIVLCLWSRFRTAEIGPGIQLREPLAGSDVLRLAVRQGDGDHPVHGIVTAAIGISELHRGVGVRVRLRAS